MLIVSLDLGLYIYIVYDFDFNYSPVRRNIKGPSDILNYSRCCGLQLLLTVLHKITFQF